jgi:hypothetical protein
MSPNQALYFVRDEDGIGSAVARGGLTADRILISNADGGELFGVIVTGPSAKCHVASCKKELNLKHTKQIVLNFVQCSPTPAPTPARITYCTDTTTKPSVQRTLKRSI